MQSTHPTETFEYKNLKFVLWDVGGQTSLRTSWAQYLTSTDAVRTAATTDPQLIFVVDSNDRERVALARAELHRVAADENLTRAPILVWANKQDVRGSMSPSEISDALNLSSFRDRTWQIFGCAYHTTLTHRLGVDRQRVRGQPTHPLADSQPASIGSRRPCRTRHSIHLFRYGASRPVYAGQEDPVLSYLLRRGASICSGCACQSCVSA